MANLGSAGGLHMYALTLQRASGVTGAVFGNFSAPRQQEIAVARGKILELCRPDDNGKVLTVVASEVFGTIRSIATFRLTGGNRDYLVVGSDSGRIVILEFVADKGGWERVHCETFGKAPRPPHAAHRAPAARPHLRHVPTCGGTEQGCTSHLPPPQPSSPLDPPPPPPSPPSPPLT